MLRSAVIASVAQAVMVAAQPEVTTDAGSIMLKVEDGATVGYSIGDENFDLPAQFQAMNTDMNVTQSALANGVSVGMDIASRAAQASIQTAQTEAAQARAATAELQASMGTFDRVLSTVSWIGIKFPMANTKQVRRFLPYVSGVRSIDIVGYGFSELHSVIFGLPDLLECRFSLPDHASYGSLSATSSPLNIRAVDIGNGQVQFQGTCDVPEFTYADPHNFTNSGIGIDVKVSLVYLGGEGREFPFVGKPSADEVTLDMAVYDIEHEGDLNTFSGTPHLKGTGFLLDMDYFCIWEHVASGDYDPANDTAVTLAATVIDSETVECNEIPPAAFSQARLEAQHSTGGDDFLITITLAAARGPEDFEVVEWSPSGSAPPTWRYDNARCIDGIQNGGEYGVDCGNRAGCGRCPENTQSLGDPCDGSAECTGILMCDEGTCQNRPGAFYPGETQHSCAAIKQACGNCGDAQYFIRIPAHDGIEKWSGLVWCTMGGPRGGGWTLIARVPDGNQGHWRWQGNRWMNRDGRDRGSIPNSGTINNGGHDFMSGAYSRMPFNDVRLSLHTQGNERVFHFGDRKKTPEYLFCNYQSGGCKGMNWNGRRGEQDWDDRGYGVRRRGDSPRGRGDFLNWSQQGHHCWNNQRYCNQNGFCVRTQSGSCHYGWMGNNENECRSNDSGIGIGCSHTSSGYDVWYGCHNRGRRGWIWVK